MPKYVNLMVYLQKLISQEHVVVIMEFSVCVQVKKIYYSWGLSVKGFPLSV